MSKIITILALILLGSSSLDVCAAQDRQTTHVKHHSHHKEATKPARNEEWYLNQARESRRFKAIALEADDANFLPENMMVDRLVQQATTSNHPIVENNKDMKSVIKKNSALADPNTISFLFVPVIPNNRLFDNKLLDLQNRSELHPTFMLFWKE